MNWGYSSLTEVIKQVKYNFYTWLQQEEDNRNVSHKLAYVC